MPGHDVVVIGASAGGVEALREIASHLPGGRGEHAPAHPRAARPLMAVHAEDEAEIVPGTIYVAPPDRQLMVEKVAFGPRVIAVVFSGNLDDGTAGLAAVSRHGGITVAQDPEDALYPGMPGAAVEAEVVDHVVPLAAMQVLNERASLSRRTAERVEQRGNVMVAQLFRESASESDRLAAVLSGVLSTAPANEPADG